MRYWPLSTICNSALMHPIYMGELHRAYQAPRLSEGTMRACNVVAGQTKTAETPLVIIESVGAPMRRIYTEYPEFEDWLRLERGAFVATDDVFVFVIDALH